MAEVPFTRLAPEYSMPHLMQIQPEGSTLYIDSSLSIINNAWDSSNLFQRFSFFPSDAFMTHMILAMYAQQQEEAP